MKKIIMMLSLIMGIVISVNAQTSLVDNGTIKDNWYFGGGIGTNVWNDGNSWTLFNAKSNVNDGKTNSWWRTQPIHVNVIAGKMVTPYLGFELDYNALFNLRGENTFLDGHNFTGNAVVNLTNLFGKYDGNRHKFEVEMLGGAGWSHNYKSYLTNGVRTDKNAVIVRGALRGNFNLSDNFAITVTPEYIWTPKRIGSAKTSKQGVNLAVGVKYRIQTKRGNFNTHKLYDYDEVNALNERIKSQDVEILGLTKTNESLTRSNNHLTETIKKMMTEGGNVVVETQNIGTILFEQGKSNVSNSDIDELVKIIKNTTGTIVLTGTTSPEGGEEINKALGTNRANAVKKALVASGVDESRIVIKDGYADKRSVVITLE